MKPSKSGYLIGLLLLCSLAGCKPLSPPTPSVGPESREDTSSGPSTGNSQASPQSTGTQSATTAAKSNLLKPPLGILPRFAMLGIESGLDFKRDDDIRGQRRIFESTGGGVAMFDFDNDGWLDLLYTGGCAMPMDQAKHEPTCGLYRNLQNDRFQSSASSGRLSQGGYCQGVTVGDYDNDGFDDVFITAFGRCGLWRNQGDGTFLDVSLDVGIDLHTWGSSCAFADLNLDGALDLYVVTYLKESAESPLRCPNSRSPDGFEQCPPSKFEGLSDVLYLNDGQGRMLDVSEQSGLNQFKGKGLGLAICDFDGDDRPDIYVGNDGEPNHLFRNEQAADGSFRLQERAMLSGVALTESGFAQASMGIAAGDFDNTGTIDLVVTNYAGDSDTVYQNLGELHFENATRRIGIAGPSRPVLGWGTVLADFNNDDRLDLAVVNGHVDDRRWLGQGEQYKMPAQIYFLQENGRYVNVAPWSGEYFESDWMARGVSCGDLNRDGRLDLAISHQLDPSVCLMNTTEVSERLMTVRLVGTRSNRNGIHGKAEVFSASGKRLAYRELCGGTSFHSCNAAELYVLAPLQGTAQLRIRWPSGQMSECRVTAGARVTMVEESRE